MTVKSITSAGLPAVDGAAKPDQAFPSEPARGAARDGSRMNCAVPPN